MAKPIPRLAPVTIATWSAIAAPSLAPSRYVPTQTLLGRRDAVLRRRRGRPGERRDRAVRVVGGVRRPEVGRLAAGELGDLLARVPGMILRREAQRNQSRPGESALLHRLGQLVPGEVLAGRLQCLDEQITDGHAVHDVVVECGVP